jgi:large subunit ribosomal protein L31
VVFSSKVGFLLRLPNIYSPVHKHFIFSELFCAKSKIPIFALPNFLQMKPEIHPKNYRLVVFKDMSNNYSFLCRSTVDTRETVKWEDGNEYPLFKLEISHKSHPFFTGQNMLIDTAGRIDKFNKRYAKKK